VQPASHHGKRRQSTPWPDSWAMMEREAPSVASRTEASPSPKATSSMGRMWMTYGSNRRPSFSTRHSKANSAPSRACQEKVF